MVTDEVLKYRDVCPTPKAAFRGDVNMAALESCARARTTLAPLRPCLLALTGDSTPRRLHPWLAMAR